MSNKRKFGPFNWNGHRLSPLAIVGMVIGGLALAVLFAFLFGWLVMLLWNWLMPTIFSLPAITYWQAWGLVLLSHILIKGGWGGGSKGGDVTYNNGTPDKASHEDWCWDCRYREDWKKGFADSVKAECPDAEKATGDDNATDAEKSPADDKSSGGDGAAPKSAE